MTNYQAANYQNRLNQYIVKEILEATPQQLLIKIYDFAIMNCRKNDLAKTNAALQELINSLNFSEQCKEISTGLLRLYLFCQDKMRRHENEIVLRILTELRETWINNFNSNK